MGLIVLDMATGYSPIVDEIKATSGDLARIEVADSGTVNVYWNEVGSLNFTQWRWRQFVLF